MADVQKKIDILVAFKSMGAEQLKAAADEMNAMQKMMQDIGRSAKAEATLIGAREAFAEVGKSFDTSLNKLTPLANEMAGLRDTIKSLNSSNAGLFSSFRATTEMMATSAKGSKNYRLAAKKQADIMLEIMDNNKGISAAQTRLSSINKVYTAGVGQLGAEFGRLQTKQKKAQMTMKQFEGGLLSNAIGASILGGQIKMLLQGMAVASLKAFTEISGETNTLNQNLTILSASWTMVQYAVGEAIASFIAANPWIIETMIAITNFINTHKELVANLIIGGIVLGSLLMIWGFLSGVVLNTVGFFKMMGPVVMWVGEALGLVSTGAVAAGGGATSMTVAWGALGALLGWIIVVLIALYAAWQTNLGGIQQFVGETLGGLWETIKAVMDKILIIFGGVIDFVVGVFSGDWEKAWLGIRKIFYGILAGIMDIAIGGVAAIWNVFAWLTNTVKDLLIGLAQIATNIFFELTKYIMDKIMNVIDWILDAANGLGINLNILGIDTGAIRNLGKTFYDEWQNNTNKIFDDIKSKSSLGYVTAEAVKQSIGASDSFIAGALGVSDAVGMGATGAGAGGTTVINNINVGADVAAQDYNSAVGAGTALGKAVTEQTDILKSYQ